MGAYMQENQPSRTALRVAIQRAAHQLLDEPVIFDDPLALLIIGRENAEALQSDAPGFDTSRLSPYLRAFTAARSRFAEDELCLGVERGVGQYVILGAGLDTFAYRNPYSAESLQVFEVDYPATQAWKRDRLAEAGLAPPQELVFAPVDFETQTLEEGLMNAGYDPQVSTFFSWLGVTPYLTSDAVMATLQFIASRPQGSGVVFDYAVPRSLLTETGRKSLDRLMQLCKLAGEPWQGFFDPGQLHRELRAHGFSQVSDLGQEEINQRYLGERSDGLRVGSVCRLMCAQV